MLLYCFGILTSNVFDCFRATSTGMYITVSVSSIQWCILLLHYFCGLSTVMYSTVSVFAVQWCILLFQCLPYSDVFYYCFSVRGRVDRVDLSGRWCASCNVSGFSVLWYILLFQYSDVFYSFSVRGRVDRVDLSGRWCAWTGSGSNSRGGSVARPIVLRPPNGATPSPVSINHWWGNGELRLKFFWRYQFTKELNAENIRDQPAFEEQILR